MKFIIQREKNTANSCPGVMRLDETDLQWYTLEDLIRADPDKSTPANEAKVYGETAIPAGLYRVCVSHSPKFGKLLPEVKNVPGYTGVRIHGGRTAADSLGCILVGKERKDADRLGNGLIASAEVVGECLAAEEAGAQIWLEILDPVEE